jgi:hypothetical protein
MEPLDVSADLEKCKSVLIVSCPICPPVSLATQTKSPFIELFKRGLKTGAFEDYIKAIREPLEQRGVRTKRARDYEAVLVLGCDSATYTAKDALEKTDCQVIQAMRATGFTNAAVRFRLPMTIDLQDTAHVNWDEGIERVGSWQSRTQA